jgi:hypothetical protein
MYAEAGEESRRNEAVGVQPLVFKPMVFRMVHFGSACLFPMGCCDDGWDKTRGVVASRMDGHRFRELHYSRHEQGGFPCKRRTATT